MNADPMSASHDPTAAPAAPNPLGSAGAIGAAWVLSIGFDLFLHAGALARMYARPDPVLLAPEAAFARIPLGYATFLVLTAALWWLVSRLDVRGALAGARFGLFSGLIVWGALCLGLWSITRMPADLLTGWWLGQAAELGLAGAVLGAARAGLSRRSIWLKVGSAVALLMAATVALQALGLAPAMKVVGSG